MHKQKARELGHPKHPVPAYLLFLQDEKFKSPRGKNETQQEWIHKSALKWKELPEDERDKYLHIAFQNIATYK